MNAIYQCEECLRYFQWPESAGGDGNFPPLIVSRPLGVIPELGVCGLPECGALKLKLAEEERAIDRAGQAKVVDFWKRKRAARSIKKEECRRKKRRAGSSQPAVLAGGDHADGWSSCPPERESFYQVPAAVHSGTVVRPMESLPHEDQVRAFAGSANAAAQNERMLELLRVGFDEGRPQVPGPWVSRAVLVREGIGVPSSRASDLRGTDQNEPHVFVARYGLDVDCSRIENHSGNDKEYYAYRLCLRSASTRLEREHRRDERQGVLPAVEGQR